MSTITRDRRTPARERERISCVLATNSGGPRIWRAHRQRNSTCWPASLAKQSCGGFVAVSTGAARSPRWGWLPRPPSPDPGTRPGSWRGTGRPVCREPPPVVNSGATSCRDRRAREGARRPGQHSVRGSSRSGGSRQGRAEPDRGGFARSARLLGVGDRAPARRSLGTPAGGCGVGVGSHGTDRTCGTHRAREHSCSAPCTASRGWPQQPGRSDPGAGRAYDGRSDSSSGERCMTSASTWRDAEPEQFTAALLAAAEQLGVLPLAVEKDYWVCEALRAITSSQPRRGGLQGRYQS
jgi:hypothetical protein